MAEPSAPAARLASLDQFRGYTVLGMFVVNFVGGFQAIKLALPILEHHHTHLSYADTIMPQFFLAVGFSYRLTFLRRSEAEGRRAAYLHVLWRCLALLLVAFVIHQLDGRHTSWASLRSAGPWGVLATAFQRNFFQTLTHIAVTSLWIAPVIAARPSIRIQHAIGSAALFHALSAGGYYDWVLQRPGIDGGPLGFLTWTIPLIVGTLAYDVVASQRQWQVWRLLAWAGLLMLVGYGLSCLNLLASPGALSHAPLGLPLIEPPFVPPSRPVNIWTMSQRAGSVTYLTFGAGFALAVYALFVAACDRGTMRIGLLRTLGTNALAGYILHDLVMAAVGPFVPRDSPLWYVGLGLAAYLGICYLILRYLEKHRLFLKL